MNTAATAQHRVALIDIGNTRMKIGWIDLATGQRESTALALEHKNVDHLDAWFQQQNIRPDKAIGVNVAGNSRAQAIEAWFLQAFSIPVQWLCSQRHAAGVLSRYADATQLGADRWIAMIGLSRIQPESSRPLLLASFGTATTLDTLCPTGLLASAPEQTPKAPLALPAATRWIYDGGLIFPGPGLMRSSLANNTAQLPEASGTTTPFPTDTHQAITTGIAAAQAGALVRQWQACLHRYGVAPCVYGTGGGWPAVQEEAQAMLATEQRLHGLQVQAIQYVASPILDGLARLAQRL